MILVIDNWYLCMDHPGNTVANREIWCSRVLEHTSQSSTKMAMSTGICPQKVLLKPNRKHTEVARPSKISPILQYQGSAPMLNQLVLRFPVHSDLYLKEKRATEDYYCSTHIQSWKLSNYDFYCHEGDDDDFDDDWIKIDLDFHFRPPKGRFQKLLSGFCRIEKRFVRIATLPCSVFCPILVCGREKFEQMGIRMWCELNLWAHSRLSETIIWTKAFYSSQTNGKLLDLWWHLSDLSRKHSIPEWSVWAVPNFFFFNFSSSYMKSSSNIAKISNLIDY